MAHFGVQKAKMVTLAGIAALSIVAGNAGNIFADDTPLPYQATVDNLTSLKTELAKTPLTREEQTGDSTYGNVIEYVGKRLELQEDLHTNGHTILFAGDEDGDEQWLNFNGHTLFLDCGDYVAYNAIEIRDSSLTMYTNKSTGGIEKPDCSSVATQTNNIHKEGSGTLEIDGGYYNSYGSLIFNHNGIAAAEPSETEKDRGLVINGGTFNAKKSANTSNEPLIQNIWFDSHTQINGGMFNLDGLSLYRSVATGYQSMADYTLEITGGTFNVLSDNETTGLLIETGGGNGPTAVIIRDGTFNAGNLSTALIGLANASETHNDKETLSSILIEGGYIEAPSLFVAGVEEVSETWQNFVDRGGFTRYPDSLNNDILDRDHRVRINGGTILTTSGLATETPDYDDMSIAGDGIYFADADVIPDDGYTKISVDNDYDDDGKNDVLVVNSDKVSEGDPVEVEVNDSKTPSDYPGAEDGVDPSELYWYISEGSEYCSVSENGEIKGLKAGKCVVVAINPYTSEVVTWNVTIKEETNPDTLDKGNSVALSIAGAVTAGFAALAVATRRFFGRK